MCLKEERVNSLAEFPPGLHCLKWGAALECSITMTWTTNLNMKVAGAASSSLKKPSNGIVKGLLSTGSIVPCHRSAPEFAAETPGLPSDRHSLISQTHRSILQTGGGAAFSHQSSPDLAVTHMPERWMAPDALMTDSHRSQLPILFIYFCSHLVVLFFPWFYSCSPTNYSRGHLSRAQVQMLHPDVMSLPPCCTSNCNVGKKVAVWRGGFSDS